MTWVTSSKLFCTLEFYENNIFYNKTICYCDRKKFKICKGEKLPIKHHPEKNHFSCNFCVFGSRYFAIYSKVIVII